MEHIDLSQSFLVSGATNRVSVSYTVSNVSEETAELLRASAKEFVQKFGEILIEDTSNDPNTTQE